MRTADMAFIDAHQHFWSLATPGHAWPTPAEPALFQDFGPGDLKAEAGVAGPVGTVLVQSQPTDRDTDWMLELAEREPLVLAVVGWVDLAGPAAVDRIAMLARRQKLRGLRPMLQAIDDTDWLLRDDLAPAIEAMIANNLRLDALVQPRHLPMLARFVDRWPTLPVVIDHAAKPFVGLGVLEPWSSDIAVLAERGVFCKLSGLRTEQQAGQPAQDLAPYVQHLVACFGDRLMWGSDWPVLRLSGDRYGMWVHEAVRLSGVTAAARDMLFKGCAERFYGLDYVLV